MRPYGNIKLTDGPDCRDLDVEGRKSSAGNIRGKGGDYRSNASPRSKAASRRNLKRRDRARREHFDFANAE